MAASRKRRRRAEPAPAGPVPENGAALESVLDAALAALDEQLPGAVIAVAVSGGRDSIALLHALARRRRAAVALAIDHGLHPDAAQWVECARACAQALGVPLQAGAVALTGVARRGQEEAARVARYRRLGELCRDAGANVLALAHHLDDVAETVLLQALRGAGLAGIAAMPTLAAEAGGPWRWRPLLELPRASIDAYVATHALRYVEDPSNGDTRFVRNALRLQVLPQIARHFPAYRQTLARLAANAAEAAELLAAVTDGDLAAVGEVDPLLGETVRLSRWLALPPARQALVLRAWLARHGLRAPARARLAEMQRQLARAAPDAAVLLTHEGHHVRRYRDWIVLAQRGAATATAATGDVAIRWRGESVIELPQLGGRLRIAEEGRDGAYGVARAALASLPLVLRARRGRERLQMTVTGPSRSLKNLFQEHGVPNWQRVRLPLAYLDGRLLWVAGIGFDVRVAVTAGERLSLRWESADAGSHFI